MRSLVILIAAFTLALSGLAFAQDNPIGKGSMQLGGGLSFASASGDLYDGGSDESQTIITFNPFVNYFVIDNLAIGLGIEYSSFSFGDFKSTTFGFGPQVEYFFNVGAPTEVKGSIYPYLGASFDYLSNTDDNGVDPEDKSTFTSIGLFGGATYMLSSSVGAFGQLEYDIDSGKRTEPVETDSESGSVFQLFVGFTFFLY